MGRSIKYEKAVPPRVDNIAALFRIARKNPEPFDWQFDDSSMPGYTLINAGAEPGGGVFPKPPEAPMPCLNVYFQCDDIDATLAKAAERGATVIVPKSPIPNVGEFAIFADPEGIVVGLFKSTS